MRLINTLLGTRAGSAFVSQTEGSRMGSRLFMGEGEGDAVARPWVFLSELVLRFSMRPLQR